MLDSKVFLGGGASMPWIAYRYIFSMWALISGYRVEYAPSSSLEGIEIMKNQMMNGEHVAFAGVETWLTDEEYEEYPTFVRLHQPKSSLISLSVLAVTSCYMSILIYSKCCLLWWAGLR